MSGTRLDEIHGPYCNILKGVLQVTPDGTISNCFLTVDEGQALAADTWLGADGKPTTVRRFLCSGRGREYYRRTAAVVSILCIVLGTARIRATRQELTQWVACDAASNGNTFCGAYTN